MGRDNKMQLQKLAGRQKPPSTGDVFRIRMTGGDYYFGLVVDANMSVGPIGGCVLAVIFEGGSKSGDLENPDELCQRALLIPPDIFDRRTWTSGHTEKIGATNRMPNIDYVFNDLAFGRFVDRFGNEVKQIPDGTLVGVWGVGTEHSLADELTAALSNS